LIITADTLYSLPLSSRITSRVNQEYLKLCKESDEFIVVINFLPVKAGDSTEDKTERTLCIIIMISAKSKVWY